MRRTVNIYAKSNIHQHPPTNLRIFDWNQACTKTNTKAVQVKMITTMLKCTWKSKAMPRSQGTDMRDAHLLQRKAGTVVIQLHTRIYQIFKICFNTLCWTSQKKVIICSTDLKVEVFAQIGAKSTSTLSTLGFQSNCRKEHGCRAQPQEPCWSAVSRPGGESVYMRWFWTCSHYIYKLQYDLVDLGISNLQTLADIQYLDQVIPGVSTLPVTNNGQWKVAEDRKIQKFRKKRAFELPCVVSQSTRSQRCKVYMLEIWHGYPNWPCLSCLKRVTFPKTSCSVSNFNFQGVLDKRGFQSCHGRLHTSLDDVEAKKQNMEHLPCQPHAKENPSEKKGCPLICRRILNFNKIWISSQRNKGCTGTSKQSLVVVHT